MPPCSWCSFLSYSKVCQWSRPVCRSLHYKAYLRGLQPYTLVLNMTFWAADGASLSVGTGAKTMILSKRFGMPNGPFNPPGGLGVPRNGSTFAIAR